MTESEFVARLVSQAEALGVSLDPAAVERFVAFRGLLQDWNRSINLVADDGDEALLADHFGDGLVHLTAIGPAAGETIVDVGAGAGLPGLVLAIARPDLRIWLVESVGKRAAFMTEAARQLALERVEVVVARAEEVGRDPAYREQADVATARRVAGLRVLLEYCLPLVRVGGRVVLAKGERVEAELAEAAGVPELLGGGPAELRLWHGRRFVMVAKGAPTPDRYPRAVGRPAKRPLGGGERR